MGFAVTVIFVVVAAGVAAFVKRRSRDKCLKDFARDMVTLDETGGEVIRGQLNVEHTGLEFVYPVKQTDENDHDHTSYILYKHEFGKITALARFHDDLSRLGKKERQVELERTYHPTAMRKFKRKVLNVFKTIRDSVMELVDMLVSHAKRATPAGAVLTSQDRYVSRMKQELMGSVGSSYEPLLEKYIGHKVVLELVKADKLFEYWGVLKEYTAEFVEIMDVNYKLKEDEPARTADLVVPRKCGIVRHLGE